MDYETEYNNRARVPEHPGIIAAWQRDAQAYRDGHRCELDLAYGDSERMVLDLFAPGVQNESAPLALFIHGGYWQAMSGKDFSHMAGGLNARGVKVAIASYDLCPDVSVADITVQMRQCCAWLWRREGQPITVFGHSAGGHLAASMLATNWPAHDDGLPERLVPCAYPISGLFDLKPLVGTSINNALGLDEVSAQAASPLFWPAPRQGSMVAAVGGRESSEFLRQSKTVCDVWGDAGVTTEYHEVDGADHFTVLNDLADADSTMVGDIHALTQKV